jgi:hypothetical protein
MNRLYLRLACLAFVIAVALRCDTGNPVDLDSTGTPPTETPPTETPMASIRGTVMAGGSPISGALIILNGPGITRAVTTELDGAFTFAALPSGVYIVTASLTGVPCGSTTAVLKAGETVTTSISCAAARRYLASITGTVTAGEAPVSGAQVTLTGFTFLGAPVAARAVMADTAGRFTFAELVQGTYTVTATAPGLTCVSQIVDIDIETGETVTANISCDENGGGATPTPPTMVGMGKIAFERSGRIMVLDLDRNNLFTFIDGRAPSWSADGRKLVFQRPACLDRSVYPYTDCDDVWMVNADGSGLSPITSSRDVLDRDPVWSPDGSKVAFVRFVHGPDQDYLVVANADPPSALWSEAVLSVWWPYSRPTWSPDGARIAFTCQGSPPLWGLDICVVPSNSNRGGYHGGLGDAVNKITNDDWIDSDPAWSPDGTRIAFTTNRAATDGRSYIALISPNGGGFTRLVPGRRPAWSPDGRRIVFVGGSDAPGLYVVNVDGSGLARITDDPADNAPSWGP